MVILAVIFGWYMLFGGSTLIAVSAPVAHRLDLPGTEFMPYVYWGAFATYVLVVFLIIKFKVRWRWAWFLGASVLGHLGVMYPTEIVQRGAVRLRVSGSLNRESQQAFETRYPVKWVSHGGRVYVRRDDYTPELAAFMADLVAHQAEPDRASAH